jgi:hypothetical protein
MSITGMSSPAHSDTAVSIPDTDMQEADPQSVEQSNSFENSLLGEASSAASLARQAAVAAIDERLEPAFALAEAIDKTIEQLSEMPLLPVMAYALTAIRNFSIEMTQKLAANTVKAPEDFPRNGTIPVYDPSSPSIIETASPSRANSTGTALKARQPHLSYAAVVRSKSPENRLAAAQHKLPPRPQPQKLDHRLFIRLDASSTFRTLHPHELSSRARRALPDGTQISKVQILASGLAIVPSSPADGEKLKASSSQLAATFGAIRAESADPWLKFIIPRVPARVKALCPEMNNITLRDISLDELEEEVSAAFKARPEQVRWAEQNSTYPETRCALAAFRRSSLPLPPAQVNLFCASLPVYLRRAKARITQCNRCFGYHRTDACTYRPRCPICSSASHTEEDHSTSMSRRPNCSSTAADCTCLPQCINCCGPHNARDSACPLRPTTDPRTGAISRIPKSQARDIRSAGRRLWLNATLCPGSTKSARRSPPIALTSPPIPQSTGLQDEQPAAPAQNTTLPRPE